MDTKQPQTMVFHFADFVLDSSNEKLSKNRQPVHLEPQLYELLLLFVQSPGALIAKSQIEKHVWAGRPVSDDAVRAAIKKLRDVLGDDARSPRFIKTVPKQGFKWLAEVSTQATSPNHHKTQLPFAALVSAAVVLLTLLSAYIWSTYLNPDIEQTEQNNGSRISRITQLSGSEVGADLHLPSQRLAFVHRETRNSPQQLYLKQLDNGIVTRLSWDQANYSNSFWSSDGMQLVFMRLEDRQQRFHIAHFDAENTITAIDDISTLALENKFVIGWLKGDSSLLLAEEMQPNKQHRIYAFDINTEALTPLSDPNVAGRGDYKALESPNGEYFAILREEVPQQASLLITSQIDGSLHNKIALPFMPSRMVWGSNSRWIGLSNFFGEHTQYLVDSKSLDSSISLPENSLDLFNACGETCYILRQHNGNFLDIQETPFVSIKPSDHDSDSILNSARLLRMADAQDFPQYTQNDNNLFFVTLRNDHYAFQYIDSGNATHDIATLHRHAQISDVTMSPDGSQIAGSADGRLFVSEVDLSREETSSVSFITSALERFAHAVWHSDNQQVYTATLSGNEPSIVLYDITSGDKQTVIEGFISFIPMPDSLDTAVAIAPDLRAHLLNNINGQWQVVKAIGKVASGNPHRLHLTEDMLYFTRHELPAAYLCAISLQNESNAPECWEIGDNRFRLNFDIDRKHERILLVESLSAESNIIRFEWN